MSHGHNRRHRTASKVSSERFGAPKPASKRLDGVKGQVTAVREEKDLRGRVERLILEERFNLPIPGDLKDRVQSLFLKRNSEASADRKSQVTRERSHVLVIVFRDQQVISGLPVSPAKARKFARQSFSHVTIERLPEELKHELAKPRPSDIYDERGWRITFWRPKAGHRREGQKGGEAVLELCDELAVLEWLNEMALGSLYGIRLLTSWKFLPLRDEDRERENAITAKIQMAFGRMMSRPHGDTSFHRARLLARLLDISDGDKDAAMERFAGTAVGKRARGQIMSGTFASQAFYYSKSLHMAYGIWNLPDARYIMCVDTFAKEAHLEPMKVDAHGLDLMDAYHNCLTNEEFQRVEWQMFQSLISGIGTAIGRKNISLAN